ncbi:hypothetical protein BH23CHL2_BH23CHL2_00870 [soil metagenome]
MREAADRFSDHPPARLLASLAVDAPQRDLWPDVAPAIEEHESLRQRRTRQIIAGTLCAVALFALGSVIWLLGDVPFVGGSERNDLPNDVVVISGDPPPTRPPLPTATSAPTPTNVELIDAALGSDLLIQGTLLGESVTFAFDPREEQSLVEVRNLSYIPRGVSPDGRWTVLFHEEFEENLETDDPDDYTRIRTLSAALDGEDMSWEYELPGSVAGWGESAIVGDRLYIISATPEPATMTALDLTTGEVVATRALEIPRLGAELRAGWVPLPEGSWYIDVGLYVTPDADEPALYAFVTLSQFGADIRNKWTRWLYRIDLDDLRPHFLSTKSITAAGESGENDVANPDFPFWNARVLPDGAGLYALRQRAQQMEITVLEFESGDIESFSTAFATVSDFPTSRTYLHTVVSNDGRKLYILSSLSGEVAIVDLAARRVERTFPLDLADLRREPIMAWNLHLSHDGRTLYIVDGSFIGTRQVAGITRVWLVDLATWRIERRIDVPGTISSFHPDPDGRSLQVVTQIEGASNPERRRYELLTYDTESWRITATWDLSELVDQGASFRLLSASDTYRDTYGRAPVVDGIEPDDVHEYTTLPRARIVVEDGRAPVGVTRPVELEFLDPATGEPLTRADPRVRYDPDEPVTLVFERPGAKSLIFVAAELGPGHQRGTVRLKEAGLWDARIISGDEESGFTLVLPDVLLGTPTFEADDGRTYDLRFETSPEEPVPVGEVFFRARFVDAATGEPLPEAVMLVSGLPETMRLTLVGAGALNRNLEAAGHGVYEATIAVQTPAHWSASLNFAQPDAVDSGAIRIEMGTLEVIEATP